MGDAVLEIETVYWIILALKFALPPLYGVVENRVFMEHGDANVLNHFRLYHVWLLVLFWFNAVTASFWLSMMLMAYSILALDVVWWVIRYVDIAIRNKNTYGEPNAWHMRTDWDNYLGLPLFLKCYWWWTVFTILCVVLGVVYFTV
jgi:hypothetical protein